MGSSGVNFDTLHMMDIVQITSLGNMYLALNVLLFLFIYFFFFFEKGWNEISMGIEKNRRETFENIL